MITCKICGEEFNTMITWKHLAKHNIKTAEYVEKYGDVVSQEYRKSRSVAYKGENNPNFGKSHQWTPEQRAKLKDRIPHNKGKKVSDESELARIRKMVETREEKYRSGVYQRASKPKTDEEKRVLSEVTKEYAKNHPEEMKRRAALMLETKKANGFDFGSTFRGKSHSEETRTLIQEKSKEMWKSRKQETDAVTASAVSPLNLTLLGEVNTHLSLQCNECGTQFTFTRQYFTPSKIKETICPTCYPRITPKVSNKEQEVYEFVNTICSDAIQSYRERYHDKEIDIFIPSKKIGIEFNGLYWHSESVSLANNSSPKKDYEKYLEFNEAGIRLIQIFEDEWENKKEIVKSRIS